MKKIFFLMTMLVALVVMTACKKEKVEQPEGTPIGELRMIEEKTDAGTRIVLIDPSGYKKVTDLTKIEDQGQFLVGHSSDGLSLMNTAGGEFCVCDSFQVKKLYQTTSTEVADSAKWIKAFIKSGNRIGIVLGKPAKNVSIVEGIKEDVILLDNGFYFFKQKGKWGICKNGEEEPIAEPNSTQVADVTSQGKTFFYINAQGQGLIDENGKGVKYATIQSLKKAGKVLWQEGNVCAITVRNI